MMTFSAVYRAFHMMSEMPAEGQQHSCSDRRQGPPGRGSPPACPPGETFWPQGGRQREAAQAAAALSPCLVWLLHFQPSPRDAAAACRKQPATSLPVQGHPTLSAGPQAQPPLQKHSLRIPSQPGSSSGCSTGCRANQPSAFSFLHSFSFPEGFSRLPSSPSPSPLAPSLVPYTRSRPGTAITGCGSLRPC